MRKLSSLWSHYWNNKHQHQLLEYNRTSNPRFAIYIYIHIYILTFVLPPPKKCLSMCAVARKVAQDLRRPRAQKEDSKTGATDPVAGMRRIWGLQGWHGMIHSRLLLDQRTTGAKEFGNGWDDFGEIVMDWSFPHSLPSGSWCINLSISGYNAPTFHCL